MEGLKKLLELPENIKEQIIQNFGSISEFYQTVFELNQEQHKLTRTNSLRPEEIAKELFDIEDTLESYGIADGGDITSDIAADYAEIIANKGIADLNKYLEPLGTDFETMQKWLKENYGI